MIEWVKCSDRLPELGKLVLVSKIDYWTHKRIIAQTCLSETKVFNDGKTWQHESFNWAEDPAPNSMPHNIDYYDYWAEINLPESK